MKRIIIVTVSCVLLLLLFSLGVMVFGPTVKKLNKARPLSIASLKTSPLVILTPSPKSLVSGVKSEKSRQSYTSTGGGYSITYPGNWTPSIGEPLSGLNGDVSVFDTGPVGNKVLGFPSFLQIAVDDNPNNLSLSDFISNHFPGLPVQTQTLGNNTWTVVSGFKNPVPTTIYLLMPQQKIYQIRFYEGSAPQITQSQLFSVLSSFSIH